MSFCIFDQHWSQTDVTQKFAISPMLSRLHVHELEKMHINKWCTSFVELKGNVFVVKCLKTDKF